MSMSDEAWARHANPLSVYSRVIGGTFVFGAFWSPFHLGLWGIVPIGAALSWIWLNPRLFRPPRNTDDWATQAVLGERAFINRGQVSIPRHHVTAALTASGLALLFLLIAVVGFLDRDFWLAFAGWHAATVAKLWFCDRMVWLWRDMRTANVRYRAWDAADWDEG